MRSKDWLTVEEARARLDYNPETGALVWKKCRDSTKIGKESKSLDVSGYVQVNIAGTLVKGHRLAWYIYHGAWPDGHIDHINGVRNDNRIANLRVVTNAINCQNKRVDTNKHGLMGVYFQSGWRAKINVNRQQIHLGKFATAEEAHAAYVEAKRKYHPGFVSCEMPKPCPNSGAQLGAVSL